MASECTKSDGMGNTDVNDRRVWADLGRVVALLDTGDGIWKSKELLDLGMEYIV